MLNGEDFGTLAATYSEDSGSKDNGGLYENITRGSFVEEYENAVFSINAGEIYPELVKSSHGYHIIKSEGIINPNGYVSREIASRIITEELNTAADEWIKNSEIEVNPQRYNSAQ